MADATRGTSPGIQLASRSPDPIRLTAGVAMTHGEVVIITTTANTALLADADAAATAVAVGFVVSHLPNQAGDTSVALGEQIDVSVPGSILKNWTDLVTGSQYFVSTNSGEICPRADLVTGDFVVRVGIALDYDTLLQVAADFNETALS